MTIEREQDTWDSLIATTLSGWQIIRGKAVGAIWGLRGFGALLSLFWLIGLAAGAIHPARAVAGRVGRQPPHRIRRGARDLCLADCRKTSRALTTTIAGLLLLNVGYIAIVYPLILVFGDPYMPSHRLGIGFTPLWPSVSLLSYRRVACSFRRRLLAPVTGPVSTFARSSTGRCS